MHRDKISAGQRWASSSEAAVIRLISDTVQEAVGLTRKAQNAERAYNDHLAREEAIKYGLEIGKLYCVTDENYKFLVLDFKVETTWIWSTGADGLPEVEGYALRFYAIGRRKRGKVMNLLHQREPFENLYLEGG